jgi:hypothetical protein
MSTSSITSRQQFDAWRASIDDYVHDFLAWLPPETGKAMDFAPASLDVLEAWLLKRYPNIDSMLVPEEAFVLNGLACYIGETIRRSAGGRWTINLEDPKMVYYGMPVLVDVPGQFGPKSPAALATTAADRRTGHFLRRFAVTSAQ